MHEFVVFSLLLFFGFCFVLIPYDALEVILVSGPDAMEQTLLPDEICKYLQILQCSKLSFPTPQDRAGQPEVVRISKKYTLRGKRSDRQQAKPHPSYRGQNLALSWGQ